MQALISKFDQHDNEDENLEFLDEPMPSWARVLLENVQAINFNMQATSIILDRLDNTLKNLESPGQSDSWEDNSPQIKIPKEPINDHPNFYNFVPSNDHYPWDRTDCQYNEVRVDIPMFKEGDDPKEYLNVDMTSSLPNTSQLTNPTPRTSSVLIANK